MKAEILREISLKEKIVDNKYMIMEEKEKDKIKIVHVPYKRRNDLNLIKSILNNNVMVEEFQTVPKKEK